MQAYDVSLSSDDTNAKEQASENAAALRITLKREPVTPPGDGFFHDNLRFPLPSRDSSKIAGDGQQG